MASKVELAKRDVLVYQALCEMLKPRRTGEEPWERAISVSDLAGRYMDYAFGRGGVRPWTPKELADLTDAQVQGSMERMEKAGMVARVVRPRSRYSSRSTPITVGWTLPDLLAERERRAAEEADKDADEKRRREAVHKRVADRGLHVPVEESWREERPHVVMDLEAVEALLDLVEGIG